MKRFNTISIFGESMKKLDYSIPDEPVGDYIVDKSHFVPNAEAIKNLTGNGAGATSDLGMYDFPDGRDTGAKVPYTRQHGYTGDIAELSSNVFEQSDVYQNDISTLKAEFDQQQRLSKYKRNAKSAQAVDAGGSSGSAE